MSDAYNPPSVDPADEDSLAGVLSTVIRKALMGMDDCMPAVVLAYDRATNRATVRPQIMMVTTSGEKVGRAQVASVPVYTYGGGGFLLSFPVKAGDRGWIKATDRDISLYLQGDHEDEGPNTKRLHSFEDGLFYPDHMKRFTIDGEDADRVVLQSTDGTTRVAMGDGVVKVVAETIELESTTLTHNGVNIGSDHTHDDVEPGAGTSGPPTP